LGCGLARVFGPHFVSMKKYLVAALPLVLVSSVLAVGVADTEVSTGVDNAEATWALVKTAIIAIVVAVLGIRFLRRLK